MTGELNKEPFLFRAPKNGSHIFYSLKFQPLERLVFLKAINNIVISSMRQKLER